MELLAVIEWTLEAVKSLNFEGQGLGLNMCLA